jgi:hypothetical protein
VQIVDQERKRGRVDADQAPLDLGLAADLDRRHHGDEKRDQPDADPAHAACRPRGASRPG